MILSEPHKDYKHLKTQYLALRRLYNIQESKHKSEIQKLNREWQKGVNEQLDSYRNTIEILTNQVLELEQKLDEYD